MTTATKSDVIIQLLKNKNVYDKLMGFIKFGINDEEKDCWEWNGTMQNNYPMIAVKDGVLFKKRTLLSARRLIYLAYGFNGTPRYVRMICGNPKCVNPNHMTTGIIDEIIIPTHDGMGKKGVNNGYLKPEYIKDIRDRYENEDINQFELAEEYGVTAGNISQIVRGKTWYI